MLILWRLLLLAVLSFAVLICYPYYQSMGFITVFIAYLAAAAAMIMLTCISSILFLSRSKFFNFTFDIVMCIGMVLLLLYFIPQAGKTRPLDKLQKGIYPTQKDIHYGLGKLGLGDGAKELQKEFNDAADEFKEGINEIHKVINKD